MATKKFLHIIMDTAGNPYGPFDDTQAACAWAKKKWPDQEQDDNYEIGEINKGWDLWALHEPD